MDERIPIEVLEILNAKETEHLRQHAAELSALLEAVVEPMPEPPIRAILKRLTRAREQAGLLQSQAAKLIGMASGSAISRYESGARELSVVTLLELCRVYDVSPAWVLTGVNPNFTDEHRQAVIDAYAKNVNIAIEDLHTTLELLESLRQE